MNSLFSCLEARIIAVSDAYDATTCDRAYRKGLSQKDTLNELVKCSGTAFDPEIVKIFVSNVDLEFLHMP